MSHDKLTAFGGEVIRGGGSGKKSPIVKITQAEGLYLQGILVNKKAFNDDEGKERFIFTLKLVDTNAPMILKGAAGYAPVDNVPQGTEVTLYGPPTRLQRALVDLPVDGTNEVLIVYEGKKREEINGRKVNAHTFKVARKVLAVAASTDELPD